MARVIRGPKPKGTPKDHNYRRITLPALRRDFQDRCAYSMQHLEFGGGDKCMEIDHHNPTRSKRTRNQYSNLFLASRNCNGAKSDVWPTPAQQQKGMRFLNCCEEDDYGAVIFEDPITHEVWGETVAARYHVFHCDLNRRHLVTERKRRAEIRLRMNQSALITNPADVLPLLGPMKRVVEQMIPSITFRPKPET